MSTIAQRAKGTPFEILYEQRRGPPKPVMTAREIAIERNRVKNRERQQAKRDAQKREALNASPLDAPKRSGPARDNKQYANWTV